MIEYFTANMWQLWALIFFICLILELSSGDFFILCFAIGAIFAGITSAITASWSAQVIVFAVFSALSIFFVRPAMLKVFHKEKDVRLSNAEALIGRTGKVSETIIAGDYGRVAIDGDDWKALSSTGEQIEVGTPVRVVKMESIIITVERV